MTSILRLSVSLPRFCPLSFCFAALCRLWMPSARPGSCKRWAPETPLRTAARSFLTLTLQTSPPLRTFLTSEIFQLSSMSQDVVAQHSPAGGGRYGVQVPRQRSSPPAKVRLIFSSPTPELATPTAEHHRRQQQHMPTRRNRKLLSFLSPPCFDAVFRGAAFLSLVRPFISALALASRPSPCHLYSASSPRRNTHPHGIYHRQRQRQYLGFRV